MIFKGNPVRMCDKRGYIRFGDHLRSNKCLSMLTDSLFEPCGFVTLSLVGFHQNSFYKGFLKDL